jgi:hypothetical protein
MQKITFLLVVCWCFYSLTGANNAYAKKETFYACKNGFQFETKQQAARCIKQQRLSFQTPQKCNKRGKLFKLKIDYRGQRDMCIAEKNINLKNEMKLKLKSATPRARSASANSQAISFAPRCGVGFQLQVRQGKDACSKGKPELVVPPSQQVTR